MNCLECRDLLQQRLDGNFSPACQPALDVHLAACPACRELHAAVPCLLEGVRAQTTPLPPSGLAERIGAALLLQARRQRRTRRLSFAAAMAASILAILTIGYFWSRQVPGQPNPAPLVRSAEPGKNLRSPSLNQSVEEAGQAVLAMTRRAANETVGQGRTFLPLVLPERPSPGVPEIEPLLEQPTKSLRDIQNGMTAGLEPVTSSARRALDLFLRELPSTDRTNKRGS
jgi:anti-sigma factor RsiW